ncbi:MAG: CPBP family intramembrane glutamic endopeptidase [Caldilineaceae bacterium]
MSTHTKALLWFLIITFGLTWGVEGVMLASGFSFLGVPPILAQYLVAGLMWAPAIGAALVRRFVLHESLRVADARLHVGPLRPYLWVLLATPVGFALVYTITLLLRLGTLDLSLQSLLHMMETASGTSVALPMPAPQFILLLFVLSSLVSPFINSIFAFGEEYGWRGFLLPHLLPLGSWQTHLISGILWGLWHAPLILMGFNYPGYPWWGILWMCGLTTLIGIIENEWTLRYNSTILAAFIHGAFNSQAYGIWRIIVPDAQPLLGGMTGLVGFVVLASVVTWVLRTKHEQS